ncbi:MAG: hypothetical protein NTZ72_18480 [Afipia sp.]|nr:hypothetical protein [Afipia sp.]
MTSKKVFTGWSSAGSRKTAKSNAPTKMVGSSPVKAIKAKKGKPKEEWVLPESISADIERLRKLLPPKIDPVYRYLREIVATLAKWQEAENWNNIRGDIYAFYDKYLPPRTKRSLYRVILEMTAGKHTKSQVISRRLAVLQYASLKGVTSDKFYKFVGGTSINEIVEAAGAIKKSEKARKTKKPQ